MKENIQKLRTNLEQKIILWEEVDSMPQEAEAVLISPRPIVSQSKLDSIMMMMISSLHILPAITSYIFKNSHTTWSFNQMENFSHNILT